MEDFSQLCHALQSEFNARSIPFSLRDYAKMCIGSLADLISEERPEQFHSAMGHFFAALYGGNELFNRLPMPSLNNLNSLTIGIPPRRLFELLNDFARVLNELSLLEMSSKTVRSALQENGFPYRPNEFFSLLEQFETTGLSTSEDSDWLTITKVGKGLGINRGCVSRLVDAGRLRDNGKTGTPRRINPASVIEYCEKEGIAYNDT